MIDYPRWLDYLEYYTDQEPYADESELLKRFPELNNSSEMLMAAMAHICAKNTAGVTDWWLRDRFPEIYQIKKLSYWRRFIHWLLGC